MNTYSYKNLNVYQDAKGLVVDVYQLLKIGNYIGVSTEKWSNSFFFIHF